MPKRVWNPEEVGLCEAIHAEPRAAFPRRVYADWLEDHGRVSYAEYIRLCCLDDPTPDSEARASALLRQHFVEWRGTLPKSVSVTFDRGRGLPLIWLWPHRWNVAKMTSMLKQVPPHLRVILMMVEDRLFHPEVGEAVFEHPIMTRVARVRACPKEPPEDAACIAFLERLASFPLPPGAEEIDFLTLTRAAEATARAAFEHRSRVTVQNPIGGRRD